MDFKCINIDHLRLHPHYDRRRLQGEEMEALVESIRIIGCVMNALHVYEDLTVKEGLGGRRLEAARRLGIHSLWCMVEGQRPSKVIWEN